MGQLDDAYGGLCEHLPDADPVKTLRFGTAEIPGDFVNA